MRAGFIGFGTLGSAIARRFIECGVEILGWNRTLDKVARTGARVAESPERVLEENEIVFLCLYDSDAVEQILERVEDRLEGRLVVDLTTNDYESVLRFHKIVRNSGGSYLESPVIGSVVPASRGELTIVVSGEENDFLKARPYLGMLASRIYFVGEPGKATKIKLINNGVLGAFMLAIAESLAIAERCGIEKELMLDVLENGAGRSTVLSAKKEKLLREDFSTHFSTRNMHKDLAYLLKLSERFRAPSLLSSIVKESYKIAMRDMEDLDFSSIYAKLREL